MDTLTVEVRKIRFCDDDTKKYIFEGMTLLKKKNSTGKIVKIRSKEIFRGTFMSLFVGDELSVEGYWKDSDYYGKQFVVVRYEKTLPQTIRGIQAFLRQTIKGMGTKRVQAITDLYGEDALRIIAGDIHALDPLPAIGKKQKEAIRCAICDNLEFEKLLSFMQLNDLDYTLALRIYDRFQGDSVARIRANPYALFMEDLLSFTACDQIAKNLGIPENSKVRLLAGLYSFLRKDSETFGNLFTFGSFVMGSYGAYLKKYGKYGEYSFPEETILKGLEQLETDGYIVSDRNQEDDVVYYLKNNLYVENKIVDLLNRKMKFSSPRIRFRSEDIDAYLDGPGGKKGKIILAPQQKEAIRTSMKSMVSIITGGPGTGKTQTMAMLIECIKGLCPSAYIHLCSPTGKAAKRMCEMSGMPASTIHRLVKIFDMGKGSEDPIVSGDFLIVDEASMIDAFVFYRLIGALDEEVRLIIIGDHEQLPSVGAGLILRDLIDSEVIPTTRLTEVFRQAQDSAIVTNSHKMIRGGTLNEMVLSKKRDGDFFFFDAASPNQVQEKILEIASRLIHNMKIPLASIQVISPVRGTCLGTEQLNRLLQKTFNPTTDIVEVEDTQFGRGDKVIHTINNYDLGVFNGETGVVDSIRDLEISMLSVAFPDKDIEYPKWTLEELELAYAITVHKSQGSEFPVVIMPVHEIFQNSLHRNLLYTAATRAKAKMIFVGSRQAFEKGLQSQRSDKRNSQIQEKLRKRFA